MKRVVFLEDLKETQIRPVSLYNEFKEILQKEILRLFPDQSLFVKINCPGCGSSDYEKAFTQLSFQYCKCNSCGTLFVSPRPTAEMIRNFYKNSQASVFWKDKVVEKTKESRYRHQVSPAAHWVLEIVDEYLPEAKVLLDYNSKYADFLGMVSESQKLEKVISISPELPKEESVLSRGNVVVYDDLNLIKEKVDLFTALEVIDRIFNPIAFFKDAYDICQKGGLFFLTTNTVSGFEYQVLKEKSPRLHPPDRMNLLSIEAIHDRLTEAGFEVIELSTPGRVDVEIVRNALESNPEVALPEFFEYIFKKRDENTWHTLQEFLQRNRLSSYVRVAARKS